jgi:hypothetical protein
MRFPTFLSVTYISDGKRFLPVRYIGYTEVPLNAEFSSGMPCSILVFSGDF